MTWLTVILISVVVYSVSVIVQRLLLRNSQLDSVIFSLVFQFLTAFCIFIYAIVTKQLVWVSTKEVLPNLLLLAIFYAIGNVLIFKSLEKIEASKFTILFSTRGIFTIISSYLILGDQLNVLQLLAVGLIILGIILVNLKDRKFTLIKDDLLALGAGLLFGLSNTNDKILLDHLNLYQYTILGFLLPGILTSIYYFLKLFLIKQFANIQIFKNMILLSILYAASAITFFMALQIADNSSLVVSTNLLSTILIGLLGIFVLKEKSNIINKIFGAIISFVGLLLLTL